MNKKLVIPLSMFGVVASVGIGVGIGYTVKSNKIVKEIDQDKEVEKLPLWKTFSFSTYEPSKKTEHTINKHNIKNLLLIDDQNISFNYQVGDNTQKWEISGRNEIIPTLYIFLNNDKEKIELDNKFVMRVKIDRSYI